MGKGNKSVLSDGYSKEGVKSTREPRPRSANYSNKKSSVNVGLLNQANVLAQGMMLENEIK